MTDASPSYSVADLVITDQLERRPSRTPDYRAEAEALAALAEELAERPDNLLQKLTETLVELGISDSAGISLREDANGEDQFRWAALAGQWRRFKGGPMPFDASLCGVVIEHDTTLLFEHPERVFPAAKVDPPIHECLLVPFHGTGKPAGALWINSHSRARKFEREDVRLLKSLSRFAAAGYQTTQALSEARAGQAQLEQRVAERTTALRKSEERLRRILETEAVGVLFFNLEGTLIGANDVFLAMTGWSRAEVESGSLHWRRMTPPEWIAATEAQVIALAETGRLGPYEKEYLRKDGGRSWMLFAGRYLGDGTVVEYVIDITDRKRAEAALRESEARIATILEQLPLGVALVDRDGNIVLKNQALGRYALDRLPSGDPGLARHWRAYAPEGQPLALPDYPGTRALRGETVVPGIDFIFTSPEGQESWTRVSAAPFRNAARDVIGAILVVQDVDREKRAEAALRESEARIAAVFDILPVGIAMVDTNRNLVLSNREMQRYLPTAVMPSLDDARSARWRGNHPDGRPFERDDFPGARALRGERVVPGVEMLYTQDDGREVWTQVAAVPIRDGEDGIIGQVAVATDIDAFKRTERALRDTGQRLEVLVDELQHRTRNLISVIHSISDRTLENSASLADFKERFRNRLGALARVNGLLSRLNEGDRITFDELIRVELSGLGVIDGNGRPDKVSLSGPDGVRLRSSTVQILALALHELATNAVKHGALASPAGRLCVTWEMRSRDGVCRLNVRWEESGVAMPGDLSRRGYGRELIERALPFQLQAETHYEVDPGGVRCSISLPISPPSEPAVMTEGRDRSARAAQHGPSS